MEDTGEQKESQKAKIAFRYGPPIVVATLICFVSSSSASGQSLFTTLAQVSATVFLAALIEMSWMVSLTDKSHRELVEMREEAKTELKVAATDEERAELLEAVDDLTSLIEESSDLFYSAAWMAREIFVFGTIAFGLPFFALAADNFGTLALGASVAALGMLLTHMFAAFMLRIDLPQAEADAAQATHEN